MFTLKKMRTQVIAVHRAVLSNPLFLTPVTIKITLVTSSNLRQTADLEIVTAITAAHLKATKLLPPQLIDMK